VQGWALEFQVLLAVGVLFLIGAVVIALATAHPAKRATARELWALYRSEFLVVGLVLLPAVMDGVAFLAAMLALTWRGQIELARLYAMPTNGLVELAAMAAAGFVVAAGWLNGAASSGTALLLGIAGIGLLGLFVSPRRAAVAAVSLLFPALLVAHLAATRGLEQGFAWFVLLYATAEINDAFALLGGKLMGRTKILPRLSPGKTAEGLLSGVVCGGTTGVVLGMLLLDLSLGRAAGAAAVILAGGLIGDMATSALKRWCGVKDFASVHALHGGVLDIYDSLLFAAPLFVLWHWAMTS
jgi:phosphatidate cytidylyltransferase